MVANHRLRQVNETVQARLDAIKIGQKMMDLPEELWHDSFRYYVKEDTTRRGGPNLRIIRLDPTKPSLTVTGFIFNKFVHPYENRFITVREAARLQGFPDDMEFVGSLCSTQQQVGNAVPVQLAKAVFDAIVKYASAIKYKKHDLHALSLFCGSGGLDLGASAAKEGTYRIIVDVATDFWDDACNTLRNYVGDSTAVVQEDIKAISSPLDFWKQHSKRRYRPDIVFGGPPCQAFSQAGKQKALNDPRGELVFDFIRFIQEIAPPFFVMENVSNIRSVKDGVLYHTILQQFDELGYNVSTDVLCAADYGAAQLRRRAIFIGCKKELGIVPLPEPLYTEESDNLLGLPTYIGVGEAFKGLPALK